MSGRTLIALAATAAVAAADRTRYLLSTNWKYEVANAAPPTCANPNTTFPVIQDGRQCTGLTNIPYAASMQSCIDSCCADTSCGVWQWCPAGNGCAGGAAANSCWTGAFSPEKCQAGEGWISRARTAMPSPAPAPTPGSSCTQTWCQPGTADGTWRTLSLPHDGVVEGNYSQTANGGQGFLPGVLGWYRKHFTADASLKSAVLYLDFDGAQSTSLVYLNGYELGNYSYGYTGFRFQLNNSVINWGGDNVIAVQVDSRVTDGWWYDGGGLYRHVWLTAITTLGPYIAPWGVYTPSNVTSPITWSGGAPGQGVPTADAMIMPQIEIWNNATSGATQDFECVVNVVDSNNVVVGTTNGQGSVAGQGGVTIWQPTAAIKITQANLWHLVDAPNKPALYTVQVTLVVSGVPADWQNVTTGIRNATFDAATGFWLNGVNTKIKGAANHQDFAGVGVAVPDHLQWYRVSKMKEGGFNGWRTAHNVPTPALMDAMDELGMVAWDENHRNSQLDQIPKLVKRDRNHPSVVIWSICNEVLCDTTGSDWVQEALLTKAAIKSNDPMMNRPVSANQNSWVGPNTPLDLQGFDYSTTSYDKWHSEAPNIPSISSETSSAVSDRDEYFNDAESGHVSAYDTNFPGWGQTAEGAWGGVGETNGQGILTRPFISGGWTWTFWDYRGEETPYSWPDVNSHFGTVDLAGFEKARFYWYQAWFNQPTNPPVLYLFPHWNWNSTVELPIWVYSNAPYVEVFVNGVTQGRQAMVQYSHLEWDKVKWVAGNITAVAYSSATSNTPLATTSRVTTGAPASIRLSIRDNVGTQLYAGCAGSDVALVMAEVVDSNGNIVPTAVDTITYALAAGSPADAAIIGTGNGDPASHVPAKSLVRPVWHGLGLTVVQAGDATGSITVTATADGLTSGQVTIPVVAQPADGSFDAVAWCRNEPRL